MISSLFSSSVLLLLFVTSSFSSFSASSSITTPLPPPNLLYIVVDDLRTQIAGAYGISDTLTPSIDRMMSQGVTFKHAYTQVTVCSPSRTSFLTGMRPHKTRTWTIGPYFRDQAHNASSIVTMTQAFKAAGYNATGAGKVWHPGSSSGGALTPSVGGDDSAYSSWSYPNATAFTGYWECDQFVNGTVQSTASVSWPGGGSGCVQSDSCMACLEANGVNATFDLSWISLPCEDLCFPDALVAQQGIDELMWKYEQQQQREQQHQQTSPSSSTTTSSSSSSSSLTPFTLFLGMKRPHLNFFAPTWAYELYTNTSNDIADFVYPPVAMPQQAFYDNGEIEHPDTKPFMYTYTNEEGHNFTLLESWKHHELRRAYRASVTFMDRQIGKVLDTLESTGFRNNTFIVFHSDHGYALGEHGEFCKQNLFELATRVPLVIVPPTGDAYSDYARNVSVDDIVELVDLYPTLAELLQVPVDAIPEGQLDGESLVPILLASSSSSPPRTIRSSNTERSDERVYKQTDLTSTTTTTTSSSSSSATTTTSAAAIVGAAFSEISRGNNMNATTSPPDGSIHGLSVRTMQWRCTVWCHYNYTASSPMWEVFNRSDVGMIELYDHRNETSDSGSSYENYDYMENVNVANVPENQGVLSALIDIIQAAWSTSAKGVF